MSNLKLFTIGTFDLFHFGHLKFLQNCNIIGDTIILALSTDEHVLNISGHKTILTYEERYKTIRQTGLVNYVHQITDNNKYEPLISSIQPDIIMVGNNWTESQLYDRLQISKQWIDLEKIMLLFNSNDPYINTTSIRNRITR